MVKLQHAKQLQAQRDAAARKNTRRVTSTTAEMRQRSRG